ncbi:MAG: thioredoxin family protein [Candidatus Brocadiia bacterium]
MQTPPKRLTTCCCALLLAAAVGAESLPETVENRHPGLASGLLTHARLTTLPNGVLLQCEDLQITAAELETVIRETPAPQRQALERQALYVLGREATSRLLPIVARRAAEREKAEGEPSVRGYLERVTAKVEVQDAAVKQFYEANRELFRGASLDTVRGSIHRHLLEEKQEQAITEHLRALGEQLHIQIAEDWVDEQALVAMENPLDRARQEGKPTVAAFSSRGCCGPDRVRPALEALEEEYDGKVRTVYLDAREHRVLALREHVRAIPTLILYDRSGREAARQAGFFSPSAIEQRFRDLEAK